MQIAVTEAAGTLAELVRRAEAGEEIVLTEAGRPTVRLARWEPSLIERRHLAIEKYLGSLTDDGPCAARSQDFLYDEDGLPA